MKLTLTILLFAAFTVFTSDISAQSRNSTVRVKVNTEKSVPRAGFRVKLLEIVDDSRCPEDTNCVWAGNATVRIQVRGGRGGRRTFELNSTGEPTSIKYSGYDIRLAGLTPHPRTNIRINRNGYVATFEIRRSR